MTRIIENTAVETKSARNEVQDLRKQLDEAKNENKEREAKFDKKVEQEVGNYERTFREVIKNRWRAFSVN